MKKRYLGFLPSILVEIWAIWYTFFVSHSQNDFILALSIAFISVFILVTILLGTMWAFGIFDY